MTSTPNPELSWTRLGLSPATLDLISKAGFDRPTPVQAEAIPLALQGRDLIASAQTGTGKTASFVLPMVEKFAGREGTLGLILSPTREIAQQTQATLELFAKPRGLRSIVLIGGINLKADEEAIRTYPQILVATPGRLCDHLEHGRIWLDYIEILVLDEADRMLDMGFADQLARITQDLSKERQTLIFSATIPLPVERLANRILKNPERVAIGRPTAATTVEQRVIRIREEEKLTELMRLFRREKGTVMVFVRTREGASRLWRRLHSRGFYEATSIHSDLLQAHREQALADFKSGKFRVLIATDVAGRGIHVDGVAHVVNFDLPLEADDYIHRVGRTGRIGATGRATSFCAPRDRILLAEIEKILGRRVPEEFESAQSASRPAARSRHGDPRSRGTGPVSDVPRPGAPQRPAPSGVPQRAPMTRGAAQPTPLYPPVPYPPQAWQPYPYPPAYPAAHPAYGLVAAPHPGFWGTPHGHEDASRPRPPRRKRRRR